MITYYPIQAANQAMGIQPIPIHQYQNRQQLRQLHGRRLLVTTGKWYVWCSAFYFAIQAHLVEFNNT